MVDRKRCADFLDIHCLPGSYICLDKFIGGRCGAARSHRHGFAIVGKDLERPEGRAIHNPSGNESYDPESTYEQGIDGTYRGNTPCIPAHRDNALAKGEWHHRETTYSPLDATITTVSICA